MYAFIHTETLKEIANVVNIMHLEVVNTTTPQQQMVGDGIAEPIEQKNASVGIFIKLLEEGYAMLE